MNRDEGDLHCGGGNEVYHVKGIDKANHKFLFTQMPLSYICLFASSDCGPFI